MNNYNIVGDVAGNYKTLLALLAQMPRDAELICLGDPVDRGPRSREVVEFLMTNGRTLQSNHAHMMTTEWHQDASPGVYSRYYQSGIWLRFNGGCETIASYVNYSKDNFSIKLSKNIPKEHIDFLESCPMYIEDDMYFFSHAPLWINFSPEDGSKFYGGFPDDFDYDPFSDFNLIWNRHVPKKPHPKLNGKINIFGHNSSDRVKVYTTRYPDGVKVNNSRELQKLISDRNYDVYGIALDTSKPDHSNSTKLTGLHIPSMTLYQQKYID